MMKIFILTAPLIVFSSSALAESHATDATATPVPCSAATAVGTMFGYTHSAATDGTLGSTGSAAY